ncbi:adenine deaminase [uncultured Mailhella sp.]|uniref:adenine deaminase n=1 Tax=uncultured Mailhella sp. TaxID=1981031 RepID=UPI00261008F3|nr:adenine deaminase [uncultured Mailhella sp.]
MDREFFEMATGRRPAELCVDNVRLVDVFGGRIREGRIYAGCGRILGFGPLTARETVDGQGGFLIPGLIDGHVHIESSLLCPARFAEAVLPSGTTTVIADPHEIANVKGVAGILYMLEASRDLPLDVRIMLSSCVPALPVEDAGACLNAEALRPLMADPRVGGLAEVMNVPGVLGGDADLMAKLDAARAAGKVVDGHAPFLAGSALDAYAALGVQTDHECTTPEELQERVARGMYVLLREGSASRDLLRLLPGLSPQNMRRCLFCTDDSQISDILERGHMVRHLRMAVAAGVDAVEAVRMATLNAAECYGLRDRGGLAPGRRADMVLVDDLKDFRVRCCWAGGELVARDGRMLRGLPAGDSGVLRSSVRLAPLPERPFAVAAPSGKARVIGLRAHSLVTDALIRGVAVDERGEVDLARNPGLLKLAVLERHHATGKIGVGLLDGRYGLRGGAIATTIAHDSHNIVVAGDSDADMLAAVREVERLGGGIVMVSGGECLASLPLPLGGLMTDRPAEETAAKLDKLLKLAASHYHIWEGADAFMTLSFLALPVIASLKLTARGLFDVENFRFVPVDAG